jgi:hypothetical protein
VAILQDASLFAPQDKASADNRIWGRIIRPIEIGLAFAYAS